MSAELKRDSDLFLKLNEEFKSKPFREPMVRTTEAKEAKAERLRARIERFVKPVEGTVLELGCGAGYLTAQLAKIPTVDEAIGVELVEDDWERHGKEGVRWVLGDMSSEDLVPNDSIDLIVSNSVFEHVSRPLQMLRSVYRALRPGGVTWHNLMLHRGACGSHAYNEVFFPWPHLLFDEDLVEGLMGSERERFSWVNRMTLGHYFDAIAEIGFHVRDIRTNVRPIDLDFYLRFEDILSRYPALDLETEFVLLVLEKPGAERAEGSRPAGIFRRARPEPEPETALEPGYLKRQLEFDAELEAHQRAKPS